MRAKKNDHPIRPFHPMESLHSPLVLFQFSWIVSGCHSQFDASRGDRRGGWKVESKLKMEVKIEGEKEYGIIKIRRDKLLDRGTDLYGKYFARWIGLDIDTVPNGRAATIPINFN